MHLDTKESEYHKLLSVREVTIVVEVWGEVVAVATFRVGTRLLRLATWSRLCCPLSFKSLPQISALITC